MLWGHWYPPVPGTCFGEIFLSIQSPLTPFPLCKNPKFDPHPYTHYWDFSLTLPPSPIPIYLWWGRFFHIAQKRVCLDLLLFSGQFSHIVCFQNIPYYLYHKPLFLLCLMKCLFASLCCSYHVTGRGSHYQHILRTVHYEGPNDTNYTHGDTTVLFFSTGKTSEMLNENKWQWWDVGHWFKKWHISKEIERLYPTALLQYHQTEPIRYFHILKISCGSSLRLFPYCY